MAFLNKAQVIGTSSNTFFTAQVGYEASVHTLLLSNPSGLDEDVTVKIYNQVTGTTVDVITVTVTAGGYFTFPKPLDLASQDQLILTSSGTSAVGTIAVYSQLVSGTEPSIVLNPTGAWSVGTSYKKLDMVDRLGSSWVALRDNVGVTPLSGADWGLVASIGADGSLSSLLGDTTPQLGGTLDTNGKAFSASSYTQIADASPTTASTYTFSFTSGDYQKVTCPTAGTLIFDTSGFVAGQVCSMMIELVNGGNCTITYPTAWKYAAGIAPTLTAAGTDSLMLVKDSSDVYSLYVLGLDVKVV